MINGCSLCVRKSGCERRETCNEREFSKRLGDRVVKGPTFISPKSRNADEK